MPILSGARLGPHEILSAIGAGGMGEVYKARDTRLDRIVAIKVLPAHLADRAELRERFEREARTIASLNHPHICTLHDIGHQGDIDFLVMEYLDGETLAQRLLKGALPIQQVLQFAIEISDALDKAHRKGITHRDLKPSNIMLTKSGTKLLDFGLAKLAQEAAPVTPESLQPTMKDAITAQGTILGTLQYMAPEQVEGKEVDTRTDIFAFGVVVYEMATSKKAFGGKTSASVMAAILKDEPPAMSILQPMSPPQLDRLVKKCLAKEPEKRWQAASDLCDELKWIAEGSPGLTVVPTAATKRIRALGPRPLPLVLGGLLLGLVVAGLTWNLKPSPPQRVTRTVINLPPSQQLPVFGNAPALALSPDGSNLAYVAIQGNTQQLYLRAMDSLEARPIAGTEGAVNPFFSPDGRWLGFFADGKLKKISVSGGAAQTLGEAVQPRGASWGSHGTIIFAPTGASSLQKVPDAGGTPKPLTRFDNGEGTHRWPGFLPDGNTFLFATGNAGAQMSAFSLQSGQRRNLGAGVFPRYAPSGHLIYVQAGTLMAAPFDAQQLTTNGTAVPVVEDVLETGSNGVAQYSISSTGTLVYIPGGVQLVQRRLVWVNRSGTEVPLGAPAQTYEAPRVSPDGHRIAVSIQGPETQIWLYDLSRETLSRLTFEGKLNADPTWTPDGKRIAFYSNKEGPTNLFWELADGSGGLERLTTSEYFHNPNSWSPDGQLLAFHEVNPTTQRDIWVLRLKDRKVEPFLRTSADESAPRFSPDGHWLAYVSNESGRFEIYIQPYPGPGGKWEISTNGGTEPVWNPNGHELIYRSGDKVMAVDISLQPGFSADKPRMLFEGNYLLSTVAQPNYDISPDGQRFLMVKSAEQTQAAPTQINVVLNWFEELKQKVPTGKK